MCSIPGGEPESLENDDQLDPEVALTALNRARAFPFCCWILIHLIAYILLLKESKFS